MDGQGRENAAAPRTRVPTVEKIAGAAKKLV
jgi:hypothetical protein